MAAIAESIERHHKLIITVLALIIVVFVLSCTFHEVIPICHWLFGCDHQMHMG
jgi:hypothetical protein